MPIAVIILAQATALLWVPQAQNSVDGGKGKGAEQATKLEIRDRPQQLGIRMSVAELKESVLALAPKERHEFVAWVNRLEGDYGDVPGEVLDQLAAEIWDQDDPMPLPRIQPGKLPGLELRSESSDNAP